MRINDIVADVDGLKNTETGAIEPSDLAIDYDEDEDHPEGSVQITVGDDYLPLSLSEWQAIIVAAKDGAIDVSVLKREFEEFQQEKGHDGAER
jgi:hypothetical protein